jgi:glutamine phosphoribosylpyrophosphate amidotransferase
LLPTIAHARYSTSGDWRTPANNQPLVVAEMALAFNGVISMGTKPEFEADFGVTCASDNDGEVFLRRLEGGEPADAFIRRINGSFAGVWLRDGRLYAGRNARRPLWRCYAHGAWWYASTADIFRRAGFASHLAPVPINAVEEAGA